MVAGPTADAERAEGRCAPTQKTAENTPAGTLGGTQPFDLNVLGTHRLPEAVPSVHSGRWGGE
jgi:hypothetical protein